MNRIDDSGMAANSFAAVHSISTGTHQQLLVDLSGVLFTGSRFVEPQHIDVGSGTVFVGHSPASDRPHQADCRRQ